jgi:hypothetical protein
MRRRTAWSGSRPLGLIEDIMHSMSGVGYSGGDDGMDDVPGKHLLRSTPSEKPRLFSRKPGPFTTGMATMVPTRVTGSMSSTSLCTTGTPLSSSPCTQAVMRRTGPGCAPAAIKNSSHTPHHITSRHITSHHITSHHITSHH